MDATHDNILYSFAVLEGCRFVTKLHSHVTYLLCSDWTLWMHILCSMMRKTIVMISYWRIFLPQQLSLFSDQRTFGYLLCKLNVCFREIWRLNGPLWMPWTYMHFRISPMIHWIDLWYWVDVWSFSSMIRRKNKNTSLGLEKIRINGWFYRCHLQDLEMLLFSWATY